MLMMQSLGLKNNLMNVSFSNDFKKKLKKSSKPVVEAFYDRLQIFVQNPNTRILNNHYLNGKFDGYKSINISGDIRAVYKLVENDFAYFVDIDNHSNLYK